MITAFTGELRWNGGQVSGDACRVERSRPRRSLRTAPGDHAIPSHPQT
jgi:hypothetical protein